MHCKAQNPNCGLETGESMALGVMGVMPCNVCCSEPQFCRECLCILCGKTMKCGHNSFTSVRCFARLSGGEFCAHGAHLTCALDCKMAGVIKALGLDMEYICRRCDQRTDLREHVIRLLESLRYVHCRYSAETNLTTAFQIMQGTEADGARQLLQLVESALQMVHNGAKIHDVYALLHGRDPEVVLD
ncbi:hypothetical protein KP509_11G037200 [Ceratopteris richardii]|uniref:Oberon-like PHD finger domain-containing protein n=1 Tax=Ceratopteris richardii TaxID=49495 RepID=A0A8T2TRI7_CERRI|nr:hypothetical protein KP509_11G037200 [Ceratopteris richardii]KAH7425038.1 hypothetical protein KP509_11G037200 [Ceratopteris richardii]